MVAKEIEGEAEFSAGIHDALGKALDGELGEAGSIEDTPAVDHEIPDETPAPAEEAKAAADTETVAEAEGEALDKPPEAKAAVPDETESQAEPPDTQAADAPGAKIAPEHWPAAEREAFEGLDDNGKDFALAQGRRLEGLHQSRSEELTGKFANLEQYREIDQAMAAQSAQLAQAGLTPATYIGRLMAYEQALRTNPAGALAQLAQDYRVDLATLSTGTPTSEAEYQDPVQVANDQRLNRIEANQQAQAQATAQAQQQQNLAQVTAFKDAIDAQGNLLHPHFADVEAAKTADAQAMRAAGQPFTLDQLYDRAIWTTQSVREKVLGASNGKAEADRAAALKAQTAKGIAATTTVASSAGGAGESQAKDMPIMNEIAARMEGTFDNG